MTSATVSQEPSDLPRLDTFPKMLLEHVRQRPARPAMREKNYGIWQSWNWADVASEIEALAAGLKALGFRRGDKLAIVGENRPRLYWAIAATQALGGIPVPVYQDSIADEMAYVLEHAEIRFALVEDQEQVDKLVAVKDRCPLLEAVIFSDPRGLRHYEQPYLHAYDRLREEGIGFIADPSRLSGGEIAGGLGVDAAIILYTSGTTGRPKGVVLTFDNLIRPPGRRSSRRTVGSRGGVGLSSDGLDRGAHVFICTGLLYRILRLVSGIRRNGIGRPARAGADLFFAPPRIFENILTQVMIRMEDAAWVSRRLFHYFIAVARRVGPALIDGSPVRWHDRVLYWIGNLLVYGRSKNALGMTRVRVAYTAGEAIGPDLFLFYRSLAINLKQLYGMTESSVFLCIQRNGETKPGTVGVPIPGAKFGLPKMAR